MMFPNLSVVAIVATFSARALPIAAAAEDCVSPKTFVCHPTTTPPVLDGDLSDWANHPEAAATSTLSDAMGGANYKNGDLAMRCSYDESSIYFAFEVAGAYRFDATDDHRCASISTMMKMGPDATYWMMGGCPMAMGLNDCEEGVPGECNNYKVDVGGHFELKTTQMEVEYLPDLESGTGNDPIANKDDEYAAGAYCRFDDDDALAANEWGAAWSHTNPPADPYGDEALAYSATSNPEDKYIFEMSRLLKTASTATDAQLEAGQVIGFGVAYWDPNQTEGPGWDKAGHYVTGCSANWINLVLYKEGMDLDNLPDSNLPEETDDEETDDEETDDEETDDETDSTDSSSSSASAMFGLVSAAMVGLI